MAVYGLIIIPPLPGSALLWAILPDGQLFEKIKKVLCISGPYLIIGIFLLIRLSGWEGVSAVLNPIVAAITGFILDF